MNEADAERFDRICSKVQYGATIKDLLWLVRLVEKLDRQLKSYELRATSSKLKAHDSQLTAHDSKLAAR